MRKIIQVVSNYCVQLESHHHLINAECYRIKCTFCTNQSLVKSPRGFLEHWLLAALVLVLAKSGTRGTSLDTAKLNTSIRPFCN